MSFREFMDRKLKQLREGQDIFGSETKEQDRFIRKLTIPRTIVGRSRARPEKLIKDLVPIPPRDKDMQC